MQRITTSAQLSAAILQLEQKQAIEWDLLKEQLIVTKESLQPFNILKNSFNNAISSPPLNNSIAGTLLGLTAGIVSKALIIGASHNPIKKIFGALLQLKVSNAVSGNAETISSMGAKLLSYFSKKEIKAGYYLFHIYSLLFVPTALKHHSSVNYLLYIWPCNKLPPKK